MGGVGEGFSDGGSEGFPVGVGRFGDADPAVVDEEVGDARDVEEGAGEGVVGGGVGLSVGAGSGGGGGFDEDLGGVGVWGGFELEDAVGHGLDLGW